MRVIVSVLACAMVPIVGCEAGREPEAVPLTADSSLPTSPRAEADQSQPPSALDQGEELHEIDAGVPPHQSTLPASTVCGLAPQELEYPPIDWNFEKPPGEDASGPFTTAEMRAGLGANNKGTRTRPAQHLAAQHGGLWLEENGDLTIHFGLQAGVDDDLAGGRVSVTVLVDWVGASKTTFRQLSDDRTNVEAEVVGAGAVFDMRARSTLVDIVIPSTTFSESRAYELAFAVRARGTVEKNLGSTFRRYVVYANGANRRPHPCIPAAVESIPIGDLIDLPEYQNYLVGRHSGILYPLGLEWELLPEIQTAAVGERVDFGAFFLNRPSDRTVAYVGIANGIPTAPVGFAQLGREGGLETSLQITFPHTFDSTAITDVWVAMWSDPYYPPADRFGNDLRFPAHDLHGLAGEHIHDSPALIGSNVLRYEISSPD